MTSVDFFNPLPPCPHEELNYHIKFTQLHIFGLLFCDRVQTSYKEALN